MKMNKLVTVCLIVAALGILIGGIGYACGGRVYGLSLGGQGIIVNSNHGAPEGEDMQYIEENKELEAFQNLNLDASFTNVQIRESDHFGIEYHVRGNRPVTTEIDGDTMTITQGRSNGAHSSFTLLSMGEVSFKDFGEEYIIVYVPKGQELGDVSIEIESGDISIDAIQATQLTIKDSFGNVELNEANVTNGIIKIESGDVKFETMEAGEMQIENSFGGIDGGQMTVGTLKLELESGDCEIADLSAENAEVNAAFGSIEFGLRESVEAYSADIDMEFGSVDVNGEDMGTKYKNTSSEGEHELVIQCESGDVSLYDVK